MYYQRCLIKKTLKLTISFLLYKSNSNSKIYHSSGVINNGMHGSSGMSNIIWNDKYFFCAKSSFLLVDDELSYKF